MRHTPFLSIGQRTILHGAFMAAGGAIAGTVQEWLQNGHIPTTTAELLPVAKLAGGAMLVYVMKEFMSNSNGQLLKKEK